MSERDLTTLETKIVAFVRRFRSANGYCPSTREIGQGVGLTSTSTVYNHLRILRRDGFLLYEDRSPRTVRPAA